MGEVSQGPGFHLLAFPVAFAQQDGRGRMTVRDSSDIHVYYLNIFIYRNQDENLSLHAYMYKLTTAIYLFINKLVNFPAGTSVITSWMYMVTIPPLSAWKTRKSLDLKVEGVEGVEG